MEAGFIAQAKAVFDSEYKSCEIDRYELTKEKDRYYIKVVGKAVFSEENLTSYMEYLHELD